MKILLPEIKTPEKAGEFLDQLEKASSVARYRLAGAYEEAPWGRGTYSASPLPTLPRSVQGQPSGIIVHYTASSSLQSAVKWFCYEPLRSERAAQIVVAQGREKVFSDEEWRTYPLLVNLPALPVICRSPKKPGVHATWTNGWTVGIELVNLGHETADAGKQKRILKVAAGRVWEEYTEPQLEVAALISRCLRIVFPAISLDAVLGHEHVQGKQTPGVLEDKRDPGPLFPWKEFREAVRLEKDPVRKDEIPQYALAMESLGYYARGPLLQSVRIFQYMMGLVPDGIVGPQTLKGLMARVLDRGFRGQV